MKKVFIAFDPAQGGLVPHSHPVFTGQVAYDLGAKEEIMFNDELGVREFASEGEAMTALNDYMREHVGEGVEREPVEPFVLLQIVSVNIPRANRPLARSVKGVQPERKKAKASKEADK